MKQAIRHYFEGVGGRMNGSLLWLFVSLFAILTLNNLVVQGLLSKSFSYLSRENWPLLWNTLWTTTLLYLIPVLIPHRVTRKVVIIVELTLICAMHIMDLYLISVYHMPYCDAVAAPIFATNASEAQGFFKSLRLDIPFMLIEGCKFILAIVIPLGLSWLIGLVRKSRDSKELHRVHQRRNAMLALSFIILVGVHILGIRYLHHTRKDNKEQVIQYNIHAPIARLILDEWMVHHKITHCNLSYRARQASIQEVSVDSLLPPHNIVLVVAEEIYPHLMHCYNPIVNKNTPTIDSLLRLNHLIKLDRCYEASSVESLAAAWTFSLCPKESPNSWDTDPTIYSIFRGAGYDTYWIDNTPRIARGLDVYPQLAADCDTYTFTNLRADDQEWTDSIPYDGAVLEHLQGCTEKSRLTTIHLIGGRSNIWWRIPSQFYQFNRLSANIDIPLSGDALDHLAQYYNVVCYQDYLFKQIINYYRDTPTLMIFCSPVGACGEWHPYSGDQLRPETKGLVPMLIYMTPQMERLRPTLREEMIQMNNSRHDLSELPRLLMNSFGVRWSQ